MLRSSATSTGRPGRRFSSDGAVAVLVLLHCRAKKTQRTEAALQALAESAAAAARRSPQSLAAPGSQQLARPLPPKRRQRQRRRSSSKDEERLQEGAPHQTAGVAAEPELLRPKQWQEVVAHPPKPR